ncbi:DNA replication and repair protein RecF, partial [Streptomyces mirabilis]
MHVTHLSLADFRSYPRVEVPLDPGGQVGVGLVGRVEQRAGEAEE